ncbi:MAG TPA: hypothetical protein PJ994_11170 [Tepidiformaceae bacterium]|nr:hypothetical protein [Tepidiformaceae bacterium]
MTTRESLHAMVDELDEGLLEEAEASLRALKEAEYDPFLVALREAPLDDEPESDEELVALRDSKGDRTSHDEVKRLIGL